MRPLELLCLDDFGPFLLEDLKLLWLDLEQPLLGDLELPLVVLLISFLSKDISELLSLSVPSSLGFGRCSSPLVI